MECWVDFEMKKFLKVKLSEKAKKGLISALSVITGLAIGYMLRYFS